MIDLPSGWYDDVIIMLWWLYDDVIMTSWWLHDAVWWWYDDGWMMVYCWYDDGMMMVGWWYDDGIMLVWWWYEDVMMIDHRHWTDYWIFDDFMVPRVCLSADLSKWVGWIKELGGIARPECPDTNTCEYVKTALPRPPPAQAQRKAMSNPIEKAVKRL